MHPTTPKPPHRAARSLAPAALLGAGVLLLPACGQQRDQPRDNGPTNAGLAALTRDADAPTIQPPPEDDFGDTRRRVLESAAMLEEVMAQAQNRPAPIAADPPANDPAQTIQAERWDPGGRSGTGGAQAVTDATEPLTRIDEPGTPAQTTAQPTNQPANEPTRFSLASFADNEEANTEIGDAGDDAPGFDPGPSRAEDPAPQAPPADPEQRKQRLVDELVGVLGELALSGEGPGSAALALAGLETLQPAALDTLKDQGVLSDAEIASLDAARELFRSLSSEDGIRDPGDVAAALDRIRRDLDARAGLRIARAELCTRVTGFGRYETFPENRFIAGRPQPVIVYTEVDRFGHRESTGPDAQPRFEIELSQRLELYHVADDLNTWNRAAEVDKTTSRNRVRDYYLINQVTLPSNLSIGKYHLKVVMRDLVTGNMAETIIPIEIVSGGSAPGRR